jgi:hypothetical protein
MLDVMERRVIRRTIGTAIDWSGLALPSLADIVRFADEGIPLPMMGGSGSDFVFNIAKGRVGEFYNRVDTNDPANSAFIILVLATSGLETDATLIDKDDVTALVSGATNEVTNTNYARKTITDANITMPAPDDANDRFDFDLPDQSWTAVAAGDGWAKLIVAYDSDTTAGTDANIIPCTAHSFDVTPDGSDITALVNAAGFYRAA